MLKMVDGAAHHFETTTKKLYYFNERADVKCDIIGRLVAECVSTRTRSCFVLNVFLATFAVHVVIVVVIYNHFVDYQICKKKSQE